jgi:hypothetical protein
VDFGSRFQHVVFRRISGPALIPILVVAIPLLLLLGLLGVTFLGIATVAGLFRGSKISAQNPNRFDRRSPDGVARWQQGAGEVIDVQSVVVEERTTTEG